MSKLRSAYSRRFHGECCPWCERLMDLDSFGLRPTRDHHPVPKSRGGIRTVICCYTCNHFKGDKTEEEWAEFRRENPEWWLRAKHPERNGPRIIRQPEKPSTPMADQLMRLKSARDRAREFDKLLRQSRSDDAPSTD